MPPLKRRARLLRFLPILERELRIAARGKAVYRWRLGIAALGLAFMAILSTTSSGSASSQIQGSVLFRGLVVVSALYAFLASMAVTADCVSREKRDGTLGLLFLTELRGYDVILGKLAANSLNTSYGLLGLLPLLAIPVMMGGVSIGSGVGATLSIVNLLFVSLSLGILVSSISWNERRATFAAIVSGLVLLIGPIMVGGMSGFFGRGWRLSWILPSLSPLFPLLSSTINLPGMSWSIVGLIPSNLLGWCFLLLAGRTAQRSWQSRSASPARKTVDELVFTPRRPQARDRHRRAMLDVHPLVWLLERHPGKRFYADGLVVAIVAIWYWGYRTYGTDMFGGPTWFLVVPLAFTVHMILSSWMVAESSMRIIEDRRSGALELLLCTSLTDREIIGGQRLVLRRLFLRPVILLVLAEVFVAFTGFGREDDAVTRNGRWMMLGMALAIAMDMIALSWIAPRMALALPNVNRVGIYAFAITPFGPLIATLMIWTAWLLFPDLLFFRPRFLTFLMIWISIVVLVDLVVGVWICRRGVYRHLRDSAVQVFSRGSTTE